MRGGKNKLVYLKIRCDCGASRRSVVMLHTADLNLRVTHVTTPTSLAAVVSLSAFIRGNPIRTMERARSCTRIGPMCDLHILLIHLYTLT